MRILFWARVATGAFGFVPSGAWCVVLGGSLRAEGESPGDAGPAPLVSYRSTSRWRRDRGPAAVLPVLLGYSMTSVTTPEPTVRPPSRIAKRRPVSMAIGWISSISIWTLSPGMTISVPSGSLATPVTSVVRK